MSVRRLSAALLVVFLALGLGQPAPAASPPQPTYGTAIVDGSIGEWNLGSDFFADMHRAGKSNGPIESKAYLRYDCDTETLYVLVLAESGVSVLAKDWESAAWGAIDKLGNRVFSGNSGDDDSPPDFKWIDPSTDGLTARGYEASFTLDPRTTLDTSDPPLYHLMLHIEVSDGVTPEASATAGYPNNGIDLEIAPCSNLAHSSIALETYLSVNGVEYQRADFAPGPNLPEGQSVSRKYLVKNNGNTTLTDIHLDGITIPSLAPGESTETTPASFTALHGQQSSTATATSGPNFHADQTFYLGNTAGLEVCRYVSVDGGVTWEDANDPASCPHTSVGEEVYSRIVIANPGPVTLGNIMLTDGSDTITELPESLEPGEWFEYLSGPVPAKPGPNKLTATATAAEVTSGVVGAPPHGDTNDANYFGEFACIDIIKTFAWKTGDGTSAGDVVTFTFTVINKGNVTLDPVTVVDNQLGTILVSPASLAPGQSAVGSKDLPITQAMIIAGSHTDIATATGTPLNGPSVTDTATQTITFSQSPSIDIVKSFAWTNGNGSKPGDVVTFSFTVTNTGNVTLDPVTVIDNKLGSILLPVTILAPGQTAVGTKELVVTQGLLDAGSHTDTATAGGTASGYGTVTDSAKQTVTFVTTPSIDVSKTYAWTKGNGSQVGDQVTFTFTVTNMGNVTLTGVGLSDNKFGTITLPTTLAPGASATATKILPITQALLDAGSHTDIATATATPSVTDTDTQTVVFLTKGLIDITKSFAWTKGDGTKAGDEVTFTFKVTNVGNVNLINVAVSDNKFGPIPVSPTNLAPGQFATGSKVYAITQSDLDSGSHTDIATASGTTPDNATVTDTATQTLVFDSAPSIDIIKTWAFTKGDGSAVGDEVTFTFTVTNTGNTVLSQVAVNDVPFGSIPVLPTSLVPGQTALGTKVYSITQDDLDLGSHADTATASGTPPTGPNVTDSATQVVCLMQMSGVDLVKKVSIDGGTTWWDANLAEGPYYDLRQDPKPDVRWRYDVENIGNVTLHALGLGDDVLGSIPPGGSVLLPGQHDLPPDRYGPPTEDQYANLGTTWATCPWGSTVHHDDFAHYLGETPSIWVRKSVSTSPNGPWDDANSPTGPIVQVGSDVYFRYEMGNNGNVTLTNITLTDTDFDGNSIPPFDPVPPDHLDPGEPWDTPYIYGPVKALPGQQVDIATATGTPPVGGNVSDSNPAHYFGANPEIDVEKYVGLTNDPNGDWEDADTSPGLVVQPNADVYFKYVVTNKSQVKLTNVRLTDDIFGPGSTPPFNPGIRELEPLESHTYPIYGPVKAQPCQHTNVATAIGSPPSGSDVRDADPANYWSDCDGPKVYQAYPGNSKNLDRANAGYLGPQNDVITAVPGLLVIKPQEDGNPEWSNYVGAFRDGIEYTIKRVEMQKTTPPIIQCADVFPVKSILQQGTPNIRLRWPLMYEVPGTAWTLTILYGTSVPYDEDGAGDEPADYVHTENWTWGVDATIESMQLLLALFHEVPFGRDEVPLISDEALYPVLQAKLQAIADLMKPEPPDTINAGLLLGEFEMEVMDACIATSPREPNPTGPGTGIAETDENPACCKLLADAEYVGKKYWMLQPTK